MGEYALTRDGSEVKIGTCESMYFLRAHEAGSVRGVAGSVDPVRDADHIRFRFPFPDEDHLSVHDGSLASVPDYDRALVVPGLEIEGLDHGTVFVTANEGTPYRVGAVLPCPHGQGDPAWATFTQSSRPSFGIVAQAVRSGRLAVVLRCMTCQSLWSFPDLEESGAIIAAVRKLCADAAVMEARHREVSSLPSPSRSSAFWHAVAERVQDGYTSPVNDLLHGRVAMVTA